MVIDKNIYFLSVNLKSFILISVCSIRIVLIYTLKMYTYFIYTIKIIKNTNLVFTLNQRNDWFEKNNTDLRNILIGNLHLNDEEAVKLKKSLPWKPKKALHSMLRPHKTVNTMVRVIPALVTWKVGTTGLWGLLVWQPSLYGDDPDQWVELSQAKKWNAPKEWQWRFCSDVYLHMHTHLHSYIYAPYTDTHEKKERNLIFGL